MLRAKDRNYIIILLTYVHRYVCLAMIILLPWWLCRHYFLLGVGVMTLLYALYTFVGYKRRWKHIFCSYQNAYRKSMTPDDIRWHQIKKADAYGIPIICGLIGLALIAIEIFANR